MAAYLPCIITIILLCLANTQLLHITSPPSLIHNFNTPNGLKVKVSPMGFKPLSGQILITLALSNPLSACTTIDRLNQNQQKLESLFLLADDQNCLESIKGKKIAESGADGAIIKQNINNTLHDKENYIIHIPIIQIQPTYFQKIKDYLKRGQTVTAIINFQTNQLSPSVIQLEIFISSTSKDSYKFLTDLHPFLIQQPIHFTPHYPLHSQHSYTQDKKYVGCLSSGKYCAPQLEYEGKVEGQNVVNEILRQIVIWKQYGGPQGYWWNYIRLSQNIMIKTGEAKRCSEKAMLLSNIDSQLINQEISKSFEGEQPKVNNNFYLEEERQAFVLEQIESYPIILINKKEYPLNLQVIKQRICQIQHKPSGQMNRQCQALIYGEGNNVGIVMIGIGGLLCLMVLLACIYKLYIKNRMEVQIKDQVSKTLNQYYKYMQTYEKQNERNQNEVQRDIQMKIIKKQQFISNKAQLLQE